MNEQTLQALLDRYGSYGIKREKDSVQFVAIVPYEEQQIFANLVEHVGGLADYRVVARSKYTATIHITIHSK